MKIRSKLVIRAMFGIQVGMLLSSYNGNDELTPEMKGFYQQLDPQAQQMFLELDSEHKAKAMHIVEQYCKAVQECKGHREESVFRQYRLQKQQKQ